MGKLRLTIVDSSPIGMKAYSFKDLVECWNCEQTFNGLETVMCSCCGNPFCRECMKEHTQP